MGLFHWMCRNQLCGVCEVLYSQPPAWCEQWAIWRSRWGRGRGDSGGGPGTESTPDTRKWPEILSPTAGSPTLEKKINLFFFPFMNSVCHTAFKTNNTDRLTHLSVFTSAQQKRPQWKIKRHQKLCSVRERCQDLLSTVLSSGRLKRIIWRVITGRCYGNV